MKIISRYKDFYDHVAYIYGVDSNVVYVRDEIKNVEIKAKEFPGYRKLLDINWNNRTEESISIVVIVDKMYFVARNHKSEERVIGSTDPLMRKRSLLDDETHNNPDMILAMTKQVGAPVYRVDWIRYDWDDKDRRLIARINEKTPRLANISGLVSLLDPQQTYQEIEYAIANRLNSSPDIDPPVEISDKYKIVAAGFDLKQSFRHRK